MSKLLGVSTSIVVGRLDLLFSLGRRFVNRRRAAGLEPTPILELGVGEVADKPPLETNEELETSGPIVNFGGSCMRNEDGDMLLEASPNVERRRSRLLPLSSTIKLLTGRSMSVEFDFLCVSIGEVFEVEEGMSEVDLNSDGRLKERARLILSIRIRECRLWSC